MLGFRPVGAKAAAAVDADLVPIDAALRSYEAAWDAHVDVWLVVKVLAHAMCLWQSAGFCCHR